MSSSYMFYCLTRWDPTHTLQQAALRRNVFNKLHALAQCHGFSTSSTGRNVRGLFSLLGSSSATQLVLIDLKIVLRFLSFTGDFNLWG